MEKRIRTVLYGDQKLTRAELEVLHTPAIQRLYALHQLGFADRVFIDASHSRLHHVVGVLEQVDKIVKAIISSLERTPDEQLRFGTAQKPRSISCRQLGEHVKSRREVVRMIGLLHDLTHAPYGHTLEDEIRLIDSKHDEPKRQADAFYRLLCQIVAWLGQESNSRDQLPWPPYLKSCLADTGLRRPGAGDDGRPEATEVGKFAALLLTGRVDTRGSWRITGREFACLLATMNCAMTALLHLEALHKPSLKPGDIPDAEYDFQKLVRQALSSKEHLDDLQTLNFEPIRDAFMLDIVGNTVCADLLDYAKRDSHFAGMHLDFDPDRITENFTVVSHDARGYETDHRDAGSAPHSRVEGAGQDPFEGWCLRTAISLVSHKFRSDLPSELMNLLNVRYYLYERAIFHPTKCAAGAMLGTALQLLGWGERPGAHPESLPANLRFAGDEVFLHDMRASVILALDRLNAAGERLFVESLPPGDTLGRVHSGILAEILRLQDGKPVNQAKSHLLAAQLLFDRLASRRFFRQVWRALPSSSQSLLNLHSESLAIAFSSPATRFEAERSIETQTELPLGSVTIHCPNRKTAQKVANVLLTMPDSEGRPKVAKLRHIALLDRDLFGEHEKALKAVEEMYGSMWRMTVYVAPELMNRREEISAAAGKVVFEAMDQHRRFAAASDAQAQWPCDPMLVAELDSKIGGKPLRQPSKSDKPSAGAGKGPSSVPSTPPKVQEHS